MEAKIFMSIGQLTKILIAVFFLGTVLGTLVSGLVLSRFKKSGLTFSKFKKYRR